MAVSAISGNEAIQSALQMNFSTKEVESDNGTVFDNLFRSVVNMYKETDDLQNAAEESEINFALGNATSTHDLAIAQQKANIALQYTVKVTNKALEAYKELMNMQI